MSSEKTVCIVGVAGFIGSHLLEKVMRERDYVVIGIDMVSPTKIQQLLGADKKWSSRFEFHQLNIVTSGPELKALIARSDVVINLAAICNPSEYIKQPVNTINSNFTDAQARRLPPNQPDLSQTGAAPRANAAADIARLRSRAPLPPLS